MSNKNGASRDQFLRETARLLAAEQAAGAEPLEREEDRQTLGLMLDALAPEKDALRPLGAAMRTRVLQQLEDAEMLPARHSHAMGYAIAAAAVLLLCAGTWFMAAQPTTSTRTAGIGAVASGESLAAIVSSSDPGESLLLESGNFNGTLTISKPLVIQANGGTVRLGAT